MKIYICLSCGHTTTLNKAMLYHQQLHRETFENNIKNYREVMKDDN